MSARPLRRIAVAAAGAAVLLALPAAAGAHVEAESQSADGVTTVTFGFHHGCDGAATTSLRVLLPEGATDIEPQDPAGWTSEVSGGELTWTGGEVPDGEEGEFVATMTLVDPEGTTVFLPTIQGCVGGAEEAWIDKSDDPEAEAAAPRITAGAVVATTPTTAHGDDGHGSATTDTTPEKTTNGGVGGAAPGTTAASSGSESAAPATENASSTSSRSVPLLIVAAVLAGAVIGGILVYSRRRSTPSEPS